MTPTEFSVVLEINAMNLSDVDALSADELATLVDDSRIALVAVGPEQTVVGFGIVVDATCGHRTPRSTWAFERGGGDVHLERVAFDMRYSGFGLGLALFDALDERIVELGEPNGVTLTSLVRVDPPNEHAVGFHASRGFTEVERRAFDGVTLALTRKTFAVDTPSSA